MLAKGGTLLIEPEVVRTMQVDALAVDVIGALTRAGVEPILLKGSALSDLYPDGNRTYKDVDLLVAPDGLTGAGRVLRDLGFRAMGHDTVSGEDQPHATTWTRPGSAAIDLHRSLWGIKAPAAVAWRFLSRHTEDHQLAGQGCRRLDPVARALHLALHAIQSGRRNPRTLDDLERGLASLPPATWFAAAELATDLEAKEAFCAGLSLSIRGRSLSTAFCPVGMDPRLSLALQAESATSAAHSLETLSRKRGWAGKLRYAARRCFPSPALLRETEPAARLIPLVPVGYLIRLIRIAWRLKSAGGELRAARRANCASSYTDRHERY